MTKIEQEFLMMRLLLAIKRHDEEVSKWLKAGGDARLVQYDPLTSWGDVLNACKDLTVPKGKAA